MAILPDDAPDAVDNACDAIDRALPRIKERTSTPSSGFNVKKTQAARKVFEQMAEDNVLTRSGEDVHLTDDEIAQSQKEAEAHRRARRSSGSRLGFGFGAATPPPPAQTA